MHAERDYLIKNVFPDLQEWCEKRKIHLNEVDLRWGVTAEDTENANTLGTCLKNIDKSRPFFLCFLGQRRGWVPNPDKDISEETKKSYPQIKDRIKGKSVTEMEIEHALLKPMHRIIEKEGKEEEKNCDPSKHALFFFKNPDYLQYLNKKQEGTYTNKYEKDNDSLKKIPKDKREEYIDKKLEKFKDKVIAKSKETDSRLKLNYYEGHWDKEHIVPELAHMGEELAKGGFTDFTVKDESLKNVILKQLKEEIATAFPDNKKVKETTELQKELDQQDLFREINIQGFIPRKESFKGLDKFLKEDDNGLAYLTAEQVLGKPCF